MPVQGGGLDSAALGRRSLLGALGLAATGGFAASGSAQTADDVGEVSIAQGGDCVPVAPLVGDEPVEAFYDLRIPESFGGDNGASDPGEGPYYQSVGTTDLQRENTTISFLYLGPEGLSLVVVHDAASDNADDSGGAVTWTVEGVPGDAEWAVKDDRYLDPEAGEPAETNYDEWNTDGDAHVVDWTWGSGGTDGGALRAPDGELTLAIRPAFNEAATLWGDHYAEDPIEEWQFLSFPDGRASPERVALALDEPLTVGTVPCGEHDAGRFGDERDGTVTAELHLKIGSFNLHRRGAIPVGLRFEEALERDDIVAESLRFGPPEVVAAGGGARPANDGHGDDLVFHFPVSETGFELGDTSAKLVGRTVDGRPIEGSVGVSLEGIERNNETDERAQGDREEDNSPLDDLFGSLF